MDFTKNNEQDISDNDQKTKISKPIKHRQKTRINQSADKSHLTEKNNKHLSDIPPFTRIDSESENRFASRQEMLESIINDLPDGDEAEAENEEKPLSSTQDDENAMKQLITFLIKENPIVKAKKQPPIPPADLRRKGVIPLWEQLSFRDNVNHMTNIEKSLMLTDIRRGLEAKEFVYLYQPQWDLATGRIESLESSLRWKHPRKGMLGPDFFFAIFEESGLIVDLLALLTEQILSDRAQLELNGLANYKIAIKFTPDQLKMSMLSENLLHLISKMNVPPETIECELTDRQFPRCPCCMRENLEMLQRAGIGLVLDNFGSGYSGYPYLLEFPFNKIKLDKSYVTDIFQNPRGQLITQSVIHTAHLLHADAIIDGVDSLQMVRWLVNAGCDYGQGCFLGGPMALEELIDFLKEYRIIAENGKSAIEDFWQNGPHLTPHFSPDC